MSIREGLTYDDVLIVPSYSNITTRDSIDVRSKYLGNWRLPIISAPMDTVSGPAMVNGIFRAGGYGILHRFDSNANLLEDVKQARKLSEANTFGVSVGVKDWDITKSRLDSYKEFGIHSICIDVAHGHHSLVVDTIKRIKEWAAANDLAPHIIAGNVATASGFQSLSNAGADAVRVGIGPGSACTTRDTTGIGVPQLTAIMDCYEQKRYYNLETDIIADGGIQKPGDIAKALVAGADAVMIGKLLAGADESNAPVWAEYRTYKGQSLNGSNGSRGAPEGVIGSVPSTGPVSETINRFAHYLRSSFSYVGACTLQEFRELAEFIRVSPATHIESGVRV